MIQTRNHMHVNSFLCMLVGKKVFFINSYHFDLCHQALASFKIHSVLRHTEKKHLSSQLSRALCATWPVRLHDIFSVKLAGHPVELIASVSNTAWSFADLKLLWIFPF